MAARLGDVIFWLFTAGAVFLVFGAVASAIEDAMTPAEAAISCTIALAVFVLGRLTRYVLANR